MPEITLSGTHLSVRNSHSLWEGAALGYYLPVTKAVKLVCQILLRQLRPESALPVGGEERDEHPEGWGSLSKARGGEKVGGNSIR